MKRKTRWLARWASFLTGVCIGLLIVAPVVALAELPFADHGSSPRLLESGQPLIDVATILLSVLLIRWIASTPQRTRQHGRDNRRRGRRCIRRPPDRKSAAARQLPDHRSPRFRRNAFIRSGRRRRAPHRRSRADREQSRLSRLTARYQARGSRSFFLIERSSASAESRMAR